MASYRIAEPDTDSRDNLFMKDKGESGSVRTVRKNGQIFLPECAFRFAEIHNARQSRTPLDRMVAIKVPRPSLPNDLNGKP
jgi:hypothetical protein